MQTIFAESLPGYLRVRVKRMSSNEMLRPHYQLWETHLTSPKFEQSHIDTSVTRAAAPQTRVNVHLICKLFQSPSRAVPQRCHETQDSAWQRFERWRKKPGKVMNGVGPRYAAYVTKLCSLWCWRYLVFSIYTFTPDGTRSWIRLGLRFKVWIRPLRLQLRFTFTRVRTIAVHSCDFKLIVNVHFAMNTPTNWRLRRFSGEAP